MKKIVFAITLSFGLSSFAVTTLKIPYFAEKRKGSGYEATALADFNVKYKLKGAERFPEYIVVEKDKVDYDTISAESDAIDAKIEKLNVKYNMEYQKAPMYVPGDSDTKKVFTCYTGKAKEAIEIVEALVSVLYSEQMGMWGWKFKKETTLVDADPEAQAWLNEESLLWKDWKGLDESILIISHIGDGGDDVQESLIVKCK